MSVRRATSVTATIVLGLSGLALAPSSADAASVWKNCTSVHHKYKHGVGRTHAHDHVTSGRPVTNFKHSTKLYRAAMRHNKGLDRDKDGVACEQH